MGTPLNTMRTDKNGKGWKKEEDALRAMRNQNLPEDVWGVVQHDGEWYLEKFADTLARARAEKAEAEKLAQSAKKEIDYRWVQFPERTNAINEPEFVEIACNGEPLTIKRGVKVVLSRPYLNVCDEAKQKTFRPISKPQIGQRPFVDSGYIARRPYTDLGPATKEDFENMLREGNDITRKEIESLAHKE